MATRANPAFAGGIVAVAILALAYTLTEPPVIHHTYIHVMTGVLWTGIDLFMGAVVGPVVGGLDEQASADVFRRLTPKTTFLLPSLAVVSIATGITLAGRVVPFPHAEPWLALFTAANLIPALALLAWRLDAWRDWRWQLPFAVASVGSLAWVGLTVDELAMTTPAIVAALAIVTVLSVQGFGVLLPGEIKMYSEMTSPDPDDGVISTIGRQNAMLGGVQGVFQLVLVVVMVWLRYGGL
jgi:hypothetical protein